MAEFTLQKRYMPLSKVEPDLAKHLAHLRQVAPESAKYLAQRLFGDTMVPGVGNKLAYEDFAGKSREGGVHVMVDGNDFGSINKRFGQSVGDEAIKAMGVALSRASRANRGKLFRVGGDEFRAYFDTPVQAHAFARHARKELEDLPPVQGLHHHSVSIGLAGTPEQAEQALIHAKDAKKAAGYAPGHALTHAHSLLPGAAGAVAMSPRQPEIPVNPPQAAASPVMGPAFQSPLGKSEPLAKMALIHDNEAAPMYVYRVQTASGVGPYNCDESPAKWSREAPRRRPSPFSDLEGDDLKTFKGPQTGHFAFEKPEHAIDWFGEKMLNKLHDAGYALYKVPAKRVWRSKSGRQVMYHRFNAPFTLHQKLNTLAKSELADEIALAARMAKTEEALSKMALIHSGPGPMPVWRIENQHGEGPYSRRSDAPSRPSDVTPTPGNDFEPHEVEANSDGSLKFAFMSPEDAETWFGKQGLTSMRSRGFQLRQVLARKVYKSKSGRQVMFEPHDPRP